MPATMKAVAAACTLVSLLAGCAAPGAPGARDGIASGSPAASAPAPRFAPSGPDAVPGRLPQPARPGVRGPPRPACRQAVAAGARSLGAGDQVLLPGRGRGP